MSKESAVFFINRHFSSSDIFLLVAGRRSRVTPYFSREDFQNNVSLFELSIFRSLSNEHTRKLFEPFVVKIFAL